jgi:hypothetical protein
MSLRLVSLLFVGLCLVGCGKDATPMSGTKGWATNPHGDSTTPAGPDVFADMTPQSGVNFSFRNGEEADEYTILETLGGGVGLIDYDRDGRLDIFLTGGGYFENKQVFGHPNRLYRNEGNWKFRDVTAEVGLDKVLHYSHGVAVGDYHNDGWPDLLVTGYGRLTLYRNHQGKFAEVTAAAGLLDPPSVPPLARGGRGGLHWSTSAAWADFNGDGFPDLFVTHYVDWSFQNHPRCPGYRPGQSVDTCSPRQFQPLLDALYLNKGDGTFRDATQEAGLKAGKGLGVLVADVNDDGKPDIYVANDTTNNFLYLNQSGQLAPRVGGEKTQPTEQIDHPVKFAEVGLSQSVATGENGKPNGSMGVDTADYDGSGNFSIFVANFQGEWHDLYRNAGRGSFVHATARTGLTVIGQDYVGWGGGFVDVDNDGDEDILVVNGHVARHPPSPSTLAQRPVLFENLRKLEDKPFAVRFAEATPTGGPYFRSDHRSRGVAAGDLDNDGKIDLVISHVNEPVVVLRNVAASPSPPYQGGAGGSHSLSQGGAIPSHPPLSRGEASTWLGIELVGKASRDVVGAKLILEVAGQTLTRQIKAGSSYLSSSDRRTVFGLGRATKVDKLTVRWPGGQTQTWEPLAPGRYWKLTEGETGAR